MIRRFFPTPGHAKEFAVYARRLEVERSNAAQEVERLLRNTPQENWPGLSDHPHLMTAGALERLGNLIADALGKDPRHALAMAELAVSVAEGLHPNAYPGLVVGQLQAHAWKDLGKAFRFLGRNAEALPVFVTAEERLSGALDHDRAIMRFHLAVSLQELDRFDESLKLLIETRELFRDYGDTSNILLSGFAEGILYQRLGKFREARETYLLLFASIKSIDRETVAALHRAIGLCSVELEDFHEAETNIKHAITLSKQIGQPLEALKGEAALGRLYGRKGQPGRAIEHLRPVRREFLRKGLVEEAGICGLEIVEGYLLLGRPSTADTLTRKIIDEFTVAGLNKRAIGALGYLTEAISLSKASPRLATRVREYIVSLRQSPERDFVAA